MLGRRPILEGVRGCGLLDCDGVVDMHDGVFTGERVSWDIQSQSWYAQSSTYRLLEGGILLLRTHGYDTVNNCRVYTCMLISISYAG
jgi:hypothetical protein